jgi:DNA-binding MarR family transcriptional regulator
MQATRTEISPQQLADEAMGFFMAVMHGPGAWLQVIADLDLSLTQLKALYRLGDVEERTVSELAGDLQLSMPAASRAVDGLVQRGLVERRECPSDRRTRRVRLSPTGRDALRNVYETRRSDLESAMAALSPQERDGLHAAIAPILERTRP